MTEKPKQKSTDAFRLKEQWRKYTHVNEPLHWTAAIGDHIAAKEMVCGLEGAKMIVRSDVDNVGRTPLMRSTLWGRNQCVDHFLQDFVQRPRPEPPQLNTTDPLGWTAFTYAAAGLQDGPTTVTVLRNLINKKDSGIDVHTKDIAGRTALHVASHMNNPHAIAFLLRYCKMDPNATDLQGRTPLHLAVGHHATSLQRRLVAPRERIVPVERHTIPPISFMLPSKDGKTLVDVEKDYLRARHKTAGKNPWDPAVQMQCVKLLLKRGADAAAKDAEGQTPIDLCPAKDEALRALLEESVGEKQAEG